MSKAHLISFKLCPFVQRSVITLNTKNIDYDITYIDLQQKPDWFLAISPFGKVPVLQVDDTVLFESAVINEYLDETTPPTLHPADPLEKARHRAWIEFGSGLLLDQYTTMTATDAASFAEKQARFAANLARVEAQLHPDGPYFAGPQLSLVDTAYAPLLMRNALLARAGVTLVPLSERLQRWTDALLARPDVQQSVPADFERLFFDGIDKGETHLKQLLATVSV